MTTQEMLKEENVHLRQRIAELEQQLAAQPRENTYRRKSSSHRQFVAPPIERSVERSLGEEITQTHPHLFQWIVEHAYDGIAVCSLNGRFVYANYAYRHMMGYGNNESRLYEEGNASLFKQFFPQIMEQGRWEWTQRLQRADKSSWLAHISALVVRDTIDQPTAVIEIVRDVTRHLESQEVLRAREMHLQHILQESPVVVYTCNLGCPNIGLSFVSNNIETRFGYTPKDVLYNQDFWNERVHPDDHSRVEGWFDRLLKRGSYHHEYRFRHARGHYVWVSDTLALIYDEDGAPKEFVGYWQDITERKMAEEEQQRLNNIIQRHMDELRIFQTLVENAPDGITVIKPDETISYANTAYRQMTGYGKELIGMNINDFYDEMSKKMARTSVQEALKKGEWQGVLTHQRQDGTTFQASLNHFLIRSISGSPQSVATIARDLTDQHRIEQERQSLQEQIIAAQREALYELSTPLIPLADHLLAMPLIGSIDTQRAQRITESMLEGIQKHQASRIILDITGVRIVDIHVADTLVQSAQAARLLGARVILTGVRPEMAQAFVELQADMSEIVTLSTLQEGIHYATNLKLRGHTCETNGSLCRMARSARSAAR